VAEGRVVHDGLSGKNVGPIPIFPAHSHIHSRQFLNRCPDEIAAARVWIDLAHYLLDEVNAEGQVVRFRAEGSDGWHP